MSKITGHHVKITPKHSCVKTNDDGMALLKRDCNAIVREVERHIDNVDEVTLVDEFEDSGRSKEELQHDYDSTRGLWCIDRDPKDVDIEWIRKNAFQLEG